MTELLKDPMFFYSIAFCIFVGFAFVKGRKPILNWIDAEIASIRAELDRAHALRTEAETLLASYRAKQAEAMAEAEAIINHAHEEAARLKAQAEADLKAGLARQEQQITERIRLAEAEAMAAVRAATVNEAMRIARETLAKQADGNAASALIDRAITDIAASKPSAAKAA